MLSFRPHVSRLLLTRKCNLLCHDTENPNSFIDKKRERLLDTRLVAQRKWHKLLSFYFTYKTLVIFIYPKWKLKKITLCNCLVTFIFLRWDNQCFVTRKISPGDFYVYLEECLTRCRIWVFNFSYEKKLESD